VSGSRLCASFKLHGITATGLACDRPPCSIRASLKSAYVQRVCNVGACRLVSCVVHGTSIGVRYSAMWHSLSRPLIASRPVSCSRSSGPASALRRPRPWQRGRPHPAGQRLRRCHGRHGAPHQKASRAKDPRPARPGRSRLQLRRCGVRPDFGVSGASRRSHGSNPGAPRPVLRSNPDGSARRPASTREKLRVHNLFTSPARSPEPRVCPEDNAFAWVLAASRVRWVPGASMYT